MVTAYDFPTARAAEQAGIDVLLVGDSLGMVVLGYETTIPVTMEDMLHHAKAVRRGAKNTFVAVDMPFMSYQVSVSDAVFSVNRLLKEGEADAIKVEGGRHILDQVRHIVHAGIPVIGHLGLTPQSVHQLGGMRAQGRDLETAVTIAKDALLLEEAGCSAIVLECVPRILATWISECLTIPTIGIGSGAGCDGQVLVFHGLVGLENRYAQKITKQYAALYDQTVEALLKYSEDVRASRFPEMEHSFKMSPEILAKVKEVCEQ